MIARKSGKIVFISSVAGKVPIPFRSSFAASKHALQAFSDTLRAEMSPYNIKVLVSNPEYIASDLTRAEIEMAGTEKEGTFGFTQPFRYRIQDTFDKNKKQLSKSFCFYLFQLYSA